MKSIPDINATPQERIDAFHEAVAQLPFAEAYEVPPIRELYRLRKLDDVNKFRLCLIGTHLSAYELDLIENLFLTHFPKDHSEFLRTFPCDGNDL